MTSIGDRINSRSRWGTTCHVNTSRQSKPPIWGSPELPRYSKVFQSMTSITGHTTADSFSWILQIPNTPVICLSLLQTAGGQPERSSRMNHGTLLAEKNQSRVSRPASLTQGSGPCWGPPLGMLRRQRGTGIVPLSSCPWTSWLNFQSANVCKNQR